MSDEIKRYDLEMKNYNSPSMELNIGGEWVKYDDVIMYYEWLDGQKQCPPYGIPVLGYLQRSADMEYELDIVHFELTERWVISTTGEEVDVIYWHVLPELPAMLKAREGKDV